MMNINAPLAYINKLKWWVLPIRPDSKQPSLPRGVHASTNSPIVVRQWFANEPESGLAVDAGRSGLLVVDVDPRNGGYDSLAKLPQLPPCPMQLTAGGGAHYVFKYKGPKLAGKLAPGIDLLGWGRYFIVSPTTINEARYQWDKDLHPLKVQAPEPPAWLLEMAAPPPIRAFVSDPSTDYNSLLARAAKWVEGAPGAVSGQNGHTQTFLVAKKLVHYFKLDDARAFDLLSVYNQKCQPKWQPYQLRHKLRQARAARCSYSDPTSSMRVHS